MVKASELFPDPEDRKKVKEVLDLFHGSITQIKGENHVDKLVIRQHMWMRGGSVGISTRYKDDLEIEILTKDKFGDRLYPKPFRLSKEKLLSHKRENFSKGVPVRVIPIKELEVIDGQDTGQTS
jgi:hypothetical protein